MFDTLAVTQQLPAGGVAREQAEVIIAKAIHDGREQGEHVTADQFRARPCRGQIVAAASVNRLNLPFSRA